eukprot:CFRG8403T1
MQWPGFNALRFIHRAKTTLANPKSTHVANPLVNSTQTSNGIITLTLDNHSKRNALSRPLMKELLAHLVQIAESDARVVVIRSSHPEVFSSGHDLKELLSKKYMESLFTHCSELMMLVRNMPQATIAAVDGLATAAGCQLVASCDLAIASTNASFCTPGVNFGLFCSTPAVALSRSVSSHKHVMEMLLTGDTFDAEYAHRIGLVNRVVQSCELEKEVELLSSKIASKSSEAIRIGKNTYWQQVEERLAHAYQLASSTMVENIEMQDATEGMKALVEKRQPRFGTTVE